MKILAKADRTYIVEATEYELCNVMGYSYPSSLPAGHKIEVGREVQVSKLYSALAVERERQKELAGLAEKLRDTAKKVDSINAALDCPIIEAGS